MEIGDRSRNVKVEEFYEVGVENTEGEVAFLVLSQGSVVNFKGCAIVNAANQRGLVSLRNKS